WEYSPVSRLVRQNLRWDKSPQPRLASAVLLADGRRDLTETLGGDHEGTLQQLLVVVDQVGEAPAEHRHGKDLLDGGLEAQQRDHLPGAQVDDADATH